jgi:hypothetical protein
MVKCTIPGCSTDHLDATNSFLDHLRELEVPENEILDVIREQNRMEREYQARYNPEEAAERLDEQRKGSAERSRKYRARKRPKA